jgi:hypothetical protein
VLRCTGRRQRPRRASKLARREVVLHGTAVVSVAGVARVCASIFTLRWVGGR